MALIRNSQMGTTDVQRRCRRRLMMAADDEEMSTVMVMQKGLTQSTESFGGSLRGGGVGRV